MLSNKVSKNLSRFIYPFIIPENIDFGNFIYNIHHQECWEFNKNKQLKDFLLPYIIDLIYDKDRNKNYKKNKKDYLNYVLFHLKLNESLIKKLTYLKNEKLYFEDKEGYRYLYSLTDIDIFIFNNKIGFIIYDCELISRKSKEEQNTNNTNSEIKINDILYFNYYFKSIKHFEVNPIQFNEKKIFFKTSDKIEKLLENKEKLKLLKLKTSIIEPLLSSTLFYKSEENKKKLFNTFKEIENQLKNISQQIKKNEMKQLIQLLKILIEINNENIDPKFIIKLNKINKFYNKKVCKEKSLFAIKIIALIDFIISNVYSNEQKNKNRIKIYTAGFLHNKNLIKENTYYWIYYSQTIINNSYLPIKSNKERLKNKSSIINLNYFILRSLNLPGYEKFSDQYLCGYNYLGIIPEKEYKKNEIYKTLFLSRRNYKENFEYSNNNDILDIQKIYNPFENVYYSFDLEGNVCLALSKPNSKHNYFQNYKDKYFIENIINLHQHYTLRYLANKTSKIPGFFSAKKLILKEQDLNQVKRIRNEIMNFSLKFHFSKISNITMHNEYYKKIKDVFSIKEQHNELKNNIKEINELLNTKYNSDINKRLNLLTFLLAPLSLISGLFGININELANKTIFKDFKFYLICVGILISIFYILIFSNKIIKILHNLIQFLLKKSKKNNRINF